jgi:hypothetical protein
VHGTLQHCSRGRSVRFQKGLVFRHFRVTRGVAGVGEAAHFRRPPPRKFSVAVGGRGLPYSDVSIIACFDSVEYLYRLNLVLQQNHVWEQPLYIYIYTHKHTQVLYGCEHMYVCVCVRVFIHLHNLSDSGRSCIVELSQFSDFLTVSSVFIFFSE